MTKTAIEKLEALASADMKQIDRLIISALGSHTRYIPTIGKHILDAGGKRLRPMLTIAGAHLCGYRGKGHIGLGMAVEFMHTATLLHDDVVDESTLRRAKPTASKLWGNSASVLVGDFLLGQSFRKMVEIGSLEALEVLSRASAIIAEGEVDQLDAKGKLPWGKQNYLNIINAKTAELFAAACEVGAILAKTDKKKRKALSDYGRHLGMAFQLVDDALDYSGKKQALGKNIGDDFREGKITLPLLLAYEKADRQEKRFWKKAMNPDTQEEQDFAKAIALFEHHKVLDMVLAEAEQYGKKAQKALSIFEKSKWQQTLHELINFCITRHY